MAMLVGMHDRFGRAIHEGDKVRVKTLTWGAKGIQKNGEAHIATAHYREGGSGNYFSFDEFMVKNEKYPSLSFEADHDLIDYIWMYKPSDLEILEKWWQR